MKKIFTLIFALTAFASTTFAQSCSDITRVKTHMNGDRVNLVFGGDATVASTFMTNVGGTTGSVTATPDGVATSTSTALVFFSSNERIRVEGLSVPQGNGNFNGTLTFNDASPAFTCTFSNGFILPVSLSSFTAKKMEKSILLAWETEMEINNDYFVVERSINGRDFEQLTEVSGKGDSEERVAYNFEDKSPKSATNYYRLRQVDFDGTEAFSEIISVKFKDTHIDLNLYPTVVREELNLDLTNFEVENVAIDILDATGRVVFNKTVNGSEIITFSSGDLNLSEGV